MAKLTLASKAPVVAYSELIAARLTNAVKPGTIEIDFVEDKKASPATFEGNSNDVLKTIVESFPEAFKGGFDGCEKWSQFASEELVVKNFQKLSVSLDKLDAQLNLRTFLLGGTSYSPADIACWGSLRSNGMVGSIIKNRVYVNVSRWYTLLEQVPEFGSAHEFLTKAVQELKKASFHRQ